MSMAMLQAGLDRSLGEGRAIVRSLGFGPEGVPAIPDAVDAMSRRGLDVSAHRSRQVTRERVDQADLILTSERDHVVGIAAESPDAARRAFTLPEFLVALADDPSAGGRSLAAWATDLTADRDPADYLGAAVDEIDDPTGSSRRRFEAATVAIEAMCDEVVDVLARSYGTSPDAQPVLPPPTVGDLRRAP